MIPCFLVSGRIKLDRVAEGISEPATAQEDQSTDRSNVIISIHFSLFLMPCSYLNQRQT